MSVLRDQLREEAARALYDQACTEIPDAAFPDWDALAPELREPWAARADAVLLVAHQHAQQQRDEAIRRARAAIHAAAGSPGEKFERRVGAIVGVDALLPLLGATGTRPEAGG